jgi:hypothetical protein
MSDTDAAVEACEASLRAIDATLSVLVVARENVINALRTIQAPPAKDPNPTMGNMRDTETCPHEGGKLPVEGTGRALCDDCGEDIEWAG